MDHNTSQASNQSNRWSRASTVQGDYRAESRLSQAPSVAEESLPIYLNISPHPDIAENLFPGGYLQPLSFLRGKIHSIEERSSNRSPFRENSWYIEHDVEECSTIGFQTTFSNPVRIGYTIPESEMSEESGQFFSLANSRDGSAIVRVGGRRGEISVEEERRYPATAADELPIYYEGQLVLPRDLKDDFSRGCLKRDRYLVGPIMNIYPPDCSASDAITIMQKVEKVVYAEAEDTEEPEMLSSPCVISYTIPSGNLDEDRVATLKSLRSQGKEAKIGGTSGGVNIGAYQTDVQTQGEPSRARRFVRRVASSILRR